MYLLEDCTNLSIKWRSLQKYAAEYVFYIVVHTKFTPRTPRQSSLNIVPNTGS